MRILNKKKIINDPVYGFINLPNDLSYDIIQHPYFQRLRRIKQLGLTYLVYPSAEHSRFSHALGAMFLMGEALRILEYKGNPITEEEKSSAQLAILLHDIGHGPFSHALEYSLVDGISHEYLSMQFMRKLNEDFSGKIQLALDIFNNQYSKRFLHNLVSSQLDVDRLDYLRRDSFFTGVSEGVIGTQRILKMLNVVDDELVVEHKGIYSIENFLNSRRIMYWQVYLHKTVISAEHLLVNLLKRARKIHTPELFASPALHYFLKNNLNAENFHLYNDALDQFAQLDDTDLISATKVWSQEAKDPILKDLSHRLINRNFFRLVFSNQEFSAEKINSLRNIVKKQLNLSEEDVDYYVIIDKTSNYIYSYGTGNINILLNNGNIVDLGNISEQITSEKIDNPTTRHFICFPKEINQDLF